MKNSVREETLTVLKGTALLTAISLGISALLGKLDFPLFWGFIFGSAYSVFNFYMIGRAIERSFKRSPESASTYMTAQYFLRFVITAAVIYIGMKVSFINFLGVIIPLIFPKLTIFASKIIRKRR